MTPGLSVEVWVCRPFPTPHMQSGSAFFRTKAVKIPCSKPLGEELRWPHAQQCCFNQPQTVGLSRVSRLLAHY